MVHTLTANALRRLAEAADGLRDTDLVLVDVPGDVTLEPKGTPSGKELIPVRTGHEATEPGLRERGVGILLVLGDRVFALPEKVDAIFLTQSAVEKFVLPYYTRHWTLSELVTFRNELFTRAENIGVYHPPTSVGKPIRSLHDELPVIREDHLHQAQGYQPQELLAKARAGVTANASAATRGS